MMKRKSSLYLIFLFVFSIFLFLQGLSKDMLLDLKFMIPHRTFYCFIMILFIYMENIYIVEEIRSLIEMKEYIIIRIKKNYKKVMIKALFKTLVRYLFINIIWCYCFIGSLPLFMLFLDFIIKSLMIYIVSKLYKNDKIYLILLVFITVCRLIVSLIL